MKKLIFYITTIIFTTSISCDSHDNETLSFKDYDRASRHLSKNLNKYLNNTITSQQWDNENFFLYSVKTEKKIESFKIDLKSNKKKASRNKFKIKNPYSINRNEFISPNGFLAAFIDDYNLWIRDLKTNELTQLTFDGEKNYGYATNNAGWIKTDGPVLKWSLSSDKIATFRQDARGVGEMYLTTTNVGHPKLQAWKYALPGDERFLKLKG